MTQRPPDDGTTLLEWILRRWRRQWRRRLALVALGGAVLWAASFLERTFYAAEVKLTYVEPKGRLTTDLLARDPMAASLQSLGLGNSGHGPRLPEMLRSRSLLKELLEKEVEVAGQRRPVFEIYAPDGTSAGDFDDTLEKVRKRYLDATYDARTDVVRLSLLAPAPALAADLANDLAARLNTRLVKNATEHARRQKLFIEERLAAVKEDLAAAEVSLREFREENRAIGDSPQLRLQEGRLLRQVHLNEQLYTTLAAQYELTKIEEVKNLPVIDVLDEATVPHRRARPRRTFRLAAGLALAVVLLMVWDATTYLGVATREEA